MLRNCAHALLKMFLLRHCIDQHITAWPGCAVLFWPASGVRANTRVGVAGCAHAALHRAGYTPWTPRTPCSRRVYALVFAASYAP
jgi:hypothetical protein